MVGRRNSIVLATVPRHGAFVLYFHWATHLGGGAPAWPVLRVAGRRVGAGCLHALEWTFYALECALHSVHGAGCS